MRDQSISYRYQQADGVNIFYREAGDPSLPVLLLLHGFPTSSHQFRNLIPLGQTLTAFVDALGLERYAMYVFDYGAPAGLRLALAYPDRVSGLISQNGNAYLEGLGEAWAPVRAYWDDPSEANGQVIRDAILTLEGVKWQYLHGVSDPQQIAPETYTLDTLLMERPGNKDIQQALFLNYASNLKRYPEFQAFFRQQQVPTLVIWGKHDPFFIPPGAVAWQRDNPQAVVEMLDSGHFALETHTHHIASRIREMFSGD